MRLTAAILLSLLLVSCDGGPTLVSEAREVLAVGVSEAEQEDLARREALGEFWAAQVTSAPDHPACPYELPEDGRDPRVQLVMESALSESPGPRFAALSAEKTRLMAEVLLGERPSTSYAREFADEVDEAIAPWAWDVTIIAHDRTRPRLTHDGVYFPGMVGGQIVLWDYEAERVVCAARVAETNSPDVIDRGRGDEAEAFESDPAAFLEADLMERVWATGLEALRQFDPDGRSADGE